MPFTTNYNVETPTVGADTDTWGGENNAAHQAWDTLIRQTQDQVATKANISGQAFTGAISAPSASFPGGVSADVTGNAGTASRLQSGQTISLSGAATGSVLFDGSQAVSIAVTLQPISMGTITGLQGALDAKLPLAGGTVSGDITREGGGGHAYHKSAAYPSAGITVSVDDPSGGADGDIWLKVA